MILSVHILHVYIKEAKLKYSVNKKQDIKQIDKLVKFTKESVIKNLIWDIKTPKTSRFYLSIQLQITLQAQDNRHKMLQQHIPSILSKPIKNTLLKSLLPLVLKNQEWTHHLTQLSKVKNLYLVVDNKLACIVQSLMGKCPICQKFLYQENLFILILHMEVQHQFNNSLKKNMRPNDGNQLVVRKYQFTYDGLEIHLVRKSSFSSQRQRRQTKKSEKLSTNFPSAKDYQVEPPGDPSTAFILGTLNGRSTLLLERIFSKFYKRLQTISTQRKYYHCYNVYRTISPQSESEDSQEQAEKLIQIQLERLRINDFNDVSQWDKILFLQWNHLVRQEKKQLKIVYENQQIATILEKFCVICKKKLIPRINLNMHLYTLWSVGRIKDFDIINLMTIYDTYVQQISQSNMDKQ